jgi:amidase
MSLIGRSALDLARLVQSGEVSPVDVVQAHLDRIREHDDVVRAFVAVRGDDALAEARALGQRRDLAALPLAGVPVAVKDVIDVAGLPTRFGSRAIPATPATADNELVTRLRAAGAIVVGKTRVPEFCQFAWTDDADGATRSPWDLSRTAGGSSGGSAAAVASAMVPLAHGSDGGGSIRIPAACCGLVGVKPGAGVVPARENDWNGLSVNGPLATTVADAAVGLSVLAARPDLRQPAPPSERLRVALSLEPGLPRVPVDDDYAGAARATAALLQTLGHGVEEANPGYGIGPMATSGARAFAGVAQSADGLRLRDLERRSRPTVVAGRALRRFGLLRDRAREQWQARAAQFFSTHDVLLTPTLAAGPIAAEAWSSRSWLANIRQASFIPFTAMWNVAGFPAVALPSGSAPGGFPLSVQLVAAPGGESLLLGLAAQIEAAQPWPRHAPLAAVTEPRGTEST